VLNTLLLAALGMLAGVAGCWFVTHELAGLLFEITPGDPVTFAGVLAILTLVATAAGYIPARRASRIDPMAALRMN
jgi:ABC-type antimicrobial peptide transport system permease subunit